MNKYIYSAAALMTLSMLTLTSCQDEMEQVGQPVGRQTLLRVTANRGDAATRTTLEHDGNGGLTCKWEAGDKLMVVDESTGKKIGVVTLVSEAGFSDGVFEGNVELTGKTSVSLVYLGTAQNAETYSAEVDNLAIDLTAQDGTFASLTKKDVLTSSSYVVENNYTSKEVEIANVSLTRQLAFGYFTLDFGSENVTLAEGDVITISGETLKASGKVNFKNGGSVAGQTAGSITITKTKAGNDFYVTMLPSGEVTPTFTVEKGGYIYTATLGKHTWKSGEFVRKNTAGEAVAVTGWTKKKAPINPYDSNNWGGDHGSYGSVPSSFINAGTNNNDAWVSNTRSMQDFGYKKTSTKRYNAIKNGHLVSWVYNDGIEAKFFQYGRLLGFPKNVVYATCNMLSYAYDSRNAKYPFGMSQNTDVQLYYCWSMNSRPTYVYSTAWNSGMELQQAINSSIVYVCGDGVDYVKSKYRSLNWNQRSGNPCPDGYRVPTKEELSVFVPSKSFTSSLVEMKNHGGVNYAVRWQLSGKKVLVTMVPSEKEITSSTDAIFSNQPQIELEAGGFVFTDSDGDAAYTTGYDDGSDVGCYWTSDIEYNEEYKLYAPWALTIEILNNKVTIGFEQWEPVNAFGIIPIKDSEAKATGFQPWFPKGY